MSETYLVKTVFNVDDVLKKIYPVLFIILK